MSIDPSVWQEILDGTRWKEDMAVVNDFGEHVWLGPCFLNGKRIGITDCCFVSDPCEKHKRFAQPQSEKP